MDRVGGATTGDCRRSDALLAKLRFNAVDTGGVPRGLDSRLGTVVMGGVNGDQSNSMPSSCCFLKKF
jgi:hypothetical protein